MDSADQIIARVSGILRDAGFTPMPEGPLAGVYCVANGTGGFVFGGVHEASGEVHAWDPGLSARTTNDPVEAAQKLADYVAAKFAPAPEAEPEPNAMSLAELDQASREAWGAANDAAQEALAETSEATPDLADDDDEPMLSDAQARQLYRGNVLDDPDTTDADFDVFGGLEGGDDLAMLEAPDLGADILDAEAEAQSGAFIFGDNLHQRRTAAIGLVTQAAIARTPLWTGDDSVRLAELRNFTMGVQEGRWADDADQRDELDTLESTLRAINAITAARDAKVAVLLTATHDDLDVFDPEADWP